MRAPRGWIAMALGQAVCVALAGCALMPSPPGRETSSSEGVVVIVNAESRVEAVTADELERLFEGEQPRWRMGGPEVQLVLPPAGSVEMAWLAQLVAIPPDSYRRQLAELVFQGRLLRPVEAESHGTTLLGVIRSRGAVGIIPSSAYVPDVKVLGVFHPGKPWFGVRARRLGLSEDQARRRDQAMSATAPPPPGFWDAQLAEEVRSTWNATCTPCHQGVLARDEVLAWPPPPQDFGPHAVTLFRGANPRTQHAAFTKIANGGIEEVVPPGFPGLPAQPRVETMPRWRGTLSNEQIWGLVYLVQMASRGSSPAPTAPPAP